MDFLKSTRRQVASLGREDRPVPGLNDRERSSGRRRYLTGWPGNRVGSGVEVDRGGLGWTWVRWGESRVGVGDRGGVMAGQKGLWRWKDFW